MVYIWEELFYENRITATNNNKNPSFTKIASSFGIKSIYSDNPTNIKEKINEFINYDGPVLMECCVENDICTPLVKPGAGLDEMIFRDDYKNIINFDSSDVPC